MRYSGMIYRLGEKTPTVVSKLEAGEGIKVVNGNSTLYTVFRPTRHRSESPAEYYKRTGCVDNQYQRRHKERFYCNPAHCRKSWASKIERDKHLDMAYAILG